MAYPIGKYLFGIPYTRWVKKVEGLSNIPNGPFILAANHSSYYETVLMYAILARSHNRQLHALVNNRYWNHPFFRIFMKWGKCIPVYIKGSKAKNEASFRKALRYLKAGKIIQIFPEGTRSHNGILKKAYPGVARLALTANVPVVPVGFTDTHKVMPRDTVIPRLKRATVKIGKPMTFKNTKNTRKNQELVTRKIMKRIAKLIGQQYNF